MKEKMFYKKVKERVERQNLTIEWVVKKAGLQPSSYYSYRKNGKLPRADVAVEIAKILEVSVEYLVTGDETLLDKDKIQEKNYMRKLEKEYMYKLLEKLEKTIKQEKEKFKTQ